MSKIIIKESEPDEKGIITIYEYHTDDNGNEYRVIKKVKRYTMMHKYYKSVEDRINNWTKFGLAAENNNVTFVSPEEIFMEPPPTKKEEESRIQSLKYIPKIIQDDYKKDDYKKGDYKKDYYKKEYKEVDIEAVKHNYKNNTFKIFSINKDVTEEELYDLFSSNCPIKQLYIPRDWKTKEVKNFAYISFFSKEDMEICFNKFNNFGYNHQRLRLEKI